MLPMEIGQISRRDILNRGRIQVMIAERVDIKQLPAVGKISSLDCSGTAQVLNKCAGDVAHLKFLMDKFGVGVVTDYSEEVDIGAKALYVFGDDASTTQERSRCGDSIPVAARVEKTARKRSARSAPTW